MGAALLKTEEALRERAQVLFVSPSMQDKWVKAVLYLRQHSKVGFALDKIAEKTPTRSLLHGYRAPIEPIRTVVSLPDDQVIPIRKGSR